MRKVFIVEDDTDIRELTSYALEGAGFVAFGFESADSFFSALEKTVPNIVLLDIMLAKTDGLTILKMLRANGRYADLPVIMLTAKGSEADKVKGLNLGADDYVTKPFGVTELIARVNAVLRRKNADIAEKKLVFEEIVLDCDKRQVWANELQITLTYTEFELLHFLMEKKGIVLSRQRIMDGVWGEDYVGESRAVDMHVKSLRQKLGAAGVYVKTVRGAGYKLGE